jgi:uncharacterized YigZ family protein
VVFFFKIIVNNPHSYISLESLSEGVYKEKGSKFIAFATPCYSEVETKNYLSEWKKMHSQARHLCYAYRLGVQNFITRANDDGEPNNSAGAPILGQIQSYELTNVLIGVLRYFGGTKLGVGGLIHAYRAAAKDAIDSGNIIQKELVENIKINFTYPQLPLIMNLIKSTNAKVIMQDFQLECNLEIYLPILESDKIKLILSDIENVTIHSKGIY